MNMKTHQMSNRETKLLFLLCEERLHSRELTYVHEHAVAGNEMLLF